MLRRWIWAERTVLERPGISLADAYLGVWVGEAGYVTTTTPDWGYRAIQWRQTSNGRVLAEWKVPFGWWVRQMDLNRSGRFVAAYLDEEFNQHVPEHDPRRATGIVALLDLTAGQLEWVATIRQDGQQDDVRQVLASDDGAHIALAGWGNGVAMVDVKAKQALWQIRPGHEVMTCTVAFSADGKTLFAGGSQGRIYAMDTLSGKVLWDWYATPDGGYDGTRIVELAASADGRYLAISTTDGRIHLVEPGTGRKLKVLQMPTAGAQVLAFHPDSTVLAAVGGGQISLWDMPAKPSSAPASVPARID